MMEAGANDRKARGKRREGKDIWGDMYGGVVVAMAAAATVALVGDGDHCGLVT